MTEKIHSNIIDEDCIKYVHPCGVTVFMCPMEGFSTVTAQFSVRFGSEDNCYVKDGVKITIPDGTAHYLEHKLFESEEKGAFELFAKTGASCNAGTSYDHTVYYFTCTDHFEENLEILLNFVQSPYFTPETVEKERGIIEQEITMYQDSPYWRTIMELLKGVYKENPIKTDIAGTAESIAEITDKILYDVYDTFYNPSNMFLCVAGNFNPDSVIEVCERCLKKRERVEFRTVCEPEPSNVVQSRTETRMPVSKPLFAIGFKRPDTDGQAALEEYQYYNALFEIMFESTSDFYNRMRSEGMINSEFSDSVFMGRGYMLPMIMGESDDPDYVLSEVTKEIRAFKADPPSKETFSRVKKAMYGNGIFGCNNVNGMVGTLTSSALAGLSPFSGYETLATMTYDGLLEKLFALDETNVCLSVIMPTE